EEIEKYLNEIIILHPIPPPKGEETQIHKRVKIILDKAGNLTSEVNGIDLQKKVFKICLADQPVDSNNVFLFHKTTHREVYGKAMKPNYNDVLLFNEKDELTEFTIREFGC
ncbi:MAG: hypothetical protein HC797_06775, partial [Anaerolineales bacterium]|nr:hypothetical protein [Anaerolineales bacterium]